jgi:integration host factor subunit alpha
VKAVTKKDLAQQIAQRLGFSQRVSLEIVTIFFAELGAIIREGKDVKLNRFGQFTTIKRPERRAMHPKSGESIQIPAQERVIFRPSRTLKAIVNGKRERKKVLSHR